MVIRPTADNIVIKVIKEDNSKTASGIILPKSTNNVRPDRGEIVALGEGRILNNGELLKSSLEMGQTVIFNRYAGTEINAGDDVYLIIKENDIMAIILEE